MAKHNFKKDFQFYTTINEQVLALRNVVIDIEAPVCRIQGTIPFDDYQEIDEMEWFNIEEEYNMPLASGMLVVDKPVQLELVLHPGFFELLTVAGPTEEHILNYLTAVLTHGMEVDFLNEENWICTKAIQQVGDKAVGMKTLWSFAKFNTYETEEDWERIVKDASDVFMKQSFLSEKGVNIDLDEIPHTNGNGHQSDGGMDQMEQMNKVFGDMMGGDMSSMQNMMSDMMKDDTFKKMTEELGMMGVMDDLMGHLAEDMPDEEEEEEFYEDNLTIVEAVTNFLDLDEWEYTVNEEETELYMTHTPIDNPTITYPCIGYIDDELFMFVFQTSFNQAIAASKRSKFAELMLRINWICQIGNLNMNFDTGVVHFRTSVDASECYITNELLSNVILENISKTDVIFPYLEGYLRDEYSINEVIIELTGDLVG